MSIKSAKDLVAEANREVDTLSAEEALALFTRDAARVQFEEHEKGTIAPGKRADLVVLDASPLAVAPSEIGALRVLRTVVAGRVVHDARGEVG